MQVRAGVRDVAKASEYLQTATSYGLLPADASRRVQLVEIDITQPDSIPPAIGNASKVCTLCSGLPCTSASLETAVRILALTCLLCGCLGPYYLLRY